MNKRNIATKLYLRLIKKYYAFLEWCEVDIDHESDVDVMEALRRIGNK